MPKSTRIQIAKKDIFQFFEDAPAPIFKQKDITSILSTHRDFWRLTQRTSTDDFIKFLVKNGKLKILRFPFPHRNETRFTWGSVSLLQVLLSISQNSYFSHYTAVQMHGLTEQIPKTIYLNHEQSPYKNVGGSEKVLEQEAIDNAFKKKARVTTNTIKYGKRNITLLSGKFTDQLGVISQNVFYDNVESKVRVTNVDRTLIDIVVRPMYSGGINEVYNAYVNAKDVASVNNMSAILKKLNYIYPYHQAIGFYLEKAGYSSKELDIIRKIPIDRDFYLTHDMENPAYIGTWRLYVPRGF